MTFKMSEEAQTITVYNLLADTCEFIGAGDAWIPPHTGLPANCTDIEPPATESGLVAVFDSGKATWRIVEDHRNQIVYDTSTAEAIYISELGPLSDNVTSVVPVCDYPKWNGSEWVTDKDAQHAADIEAANQQKTALLAEAQETISFWQTELQLGIISDEDKNSLIAWMSYTKAVQAVDTSKAPDIIWPEKPA